jgi:DNA-binding MarR family transcriptional regulator
MNNELARRLSTGSAALAHDAGALYDAMTDLIRIYQFRDRDRVGYHGLTITQCYVLQLLLRRGPLTLNSLVAEMRLDKSVLSRVVDVLERKRAIRRVANPEDGRSQLIQITSSGSASYLRMEGDVVDEYVEVLSDFPAATRRQMIDLIGGLTRALLAREMSPIEDPER